MPNKSRFMTMPRIIAGLLIVLIASLIAPSLEARDDVEYGRYLGVRLRMYDEAYGVLDKAIKGGDKSTAIRAKQVKAQVMKTQADNEFAEDESQRLALYQKALDEFELADKVTEQEPAAVVSKGSMMLELAMSLRRTNPEKAREFACGTQSAFDGNKGYRDGGARKVLNALRQHLDDNVRFQNERRWNEIYEDYSRMYFMFCRSFYVEAMTYETGSPEREKALQFCQSQLDEFQFALDAPTEELVLSYALMGDMELARGNYADAAAKFVDVVNFLSGSLPNAYIGRLAMENGYLRAAEIYTTELDFEPENLERVVDMYSEAYNRYGGFSDLDYMFKRFQLYRISALIKLGNEEQIEGAIDLLFSLAADDDITFRRQALIVLADIATRENLDNELRFKCAGAVYADLDSNPVSVILKNIQAYQSLLMACNDLRTFETYAPACFTRMGEMYSRMWRFLDAALVYQEATYRTIYFREKFGKDGKPDAHMLGRCKLIDDPGTPYKFPGQMADDFARHAGFLVSGSYGDPDNRRFKELADKAQRLKAALGEESAQWDLASNQAFELYSNDNYAQAAVKYLSLPPQYRSFHISLYIGAKSYFNLSEDRRARRINTRGADDEVESEEWFAEQRARHAEDLSALPESMWKGLEAPHWDAIQDSGTDGQLANWHKAVYYYKKYFLFECVKNWDDIEERINEIESPTLLDGINAVAREANRKWLRDNPDGKGEPDGNMKRMGFAAYDLAFLLRNPPRSVGDTVRAELRADGRELALGILRPFWDWFGMHLQESPAYKKGALKLAFYALSEAKDADACEQAYRAYLEAFPEDETELRRMVTNVYSILLDVLQPRTAAMASVSNSLFSRSNQLKKNIFERINDKDYPEDAKRLNEAGTRHERQLVLADHFWNVWMLEKLFEGDNRDDIESYLSDIRPTVTKKWDEMKEEYPKRWAEAMREEFDRRVKEDNFKSIADAAKKAVGADNLKNNLKIVDELNKLRSSSDDGAVVQKYVELTSYITLQTDALRYFTGTLFIYEWGGFLESVSETIDARSRPLTTRILKYYEEYRLRAGKEGAAGLSEGNLKTLGTQYFRIRDWRNTVKYLGAFKESVEGASVNPWGNENAIPIGRNNLVGNTRSGEELETKYRLGKAHLELYKETSDVEHLKKAALLIRRCWCFNLVRDANELSGKKFRLQFQKEIEDNYLYVGRAMSEIFLLIHESDQEIEIDWPQYHNQYTGNLQQDKDNPYQAVPENKPAYLWEAGRIHLRVWASFRLLDSYQYREEFRYNLEQWLKLAIRWVNAYGTDDKDIEVLKGDGARQFLQDAYNIATTEAALPSKHLPQEMRSYLERLGDYAEQVAAAAKKHDVTINTGSND